MQTIEQVNIHLYNQYSIGKHNMGKSSHMTSKKVPTFNLPKNRESLRTALDHFSSEPDV